MEVQRSFSIKHTRFLVFFVSISFSLVFLTTFSIWVVQESHFHLAKSSLDLGFKPLTSNQTLTGFSTNSSADEVRNEFLTRAHLGRPVNASEIANISRFKGIPTDEESRKVDAVNGNFSGLISVNNSLSIVNNTYEFGRDSAFGARNGSSVTSVQSDTLAGRGKISISDKIEEKEERICDISKGKWVFDESYPLYTTASCPFIDEGFDCEGNGRLNKDYMKWRWQPQDCNIPRFNATNMLELIRGKRLVFVGDSINRNQWESMLCLLMGALKDPKRVYETHRRRITKNQGNYCFKFVDYKCTVEYYVTHFLVHESKARIGKKRVPTLQIDTIDRGSSRWKGADILIFNSAHWWSHFKTKSGLNYYQEGGQVHPQLDVATAFRKAMLTWSSWVDKYVKSQRTKVIFRSSSPSHFRGGQWNAGGHCKEASRPLNDSSTMNYPEKSIIVEEVISQMETPVVLLNITGLSDYRIDGHPSIYGRRPGQRYSSGGEDCSHWCLPGVPDTWNELLYFQLQSKLR